MEAKELGAFGEELACEYLVKKGFKILGRNYTIPLGEIDIIAKRKFRLFQRNDPVIHFIEVKAGSAIDGFSPESRVNYRKQQKLSRLAEAWLKAHHFTPNHPCQIDVVGITVSPGTGAPSISYFPNAVEARW